jgi:hypothetical protein
MLSIQSRRSKIQDGSGTVVPKPIAMWNTVNIFADQQATGEHNNIIGAIVITPPTCSCREYLPF